MVQQDTPFGLTLLSVGSDFLGSRLLACLTSTTLLQHATEEFSRRLGTIEQVAATMLSSDSNNQHVIEFRRAGTATIVIQRKRLDTEAASVLASQLVQFLRENGAQKIVMVGSITSAGRGVYHHSAGNGSKTDEGMQVLSEQTTIGDHTTSMMMHLLRVLSVSHELYCVGAAPKPGDQPNETVKILGQKIVSILSEGSEKVEVNWDQFKRITYRKEDLGNKGETISQLYIGVIFDLGGVVLASPFPAIKSFEQQHHLPQGFISRVIKAGGAEGAFSRFERSEIDLDGFDALFTKECERAYSSTSKSPYPAGATGRAFIVELDHMFQTIRPEMVQAILTLRENGIKTCAVTNNYYSDADNLSHEYSEDFLNQARPVDQESGQLSGAAPLPFHFSKSREAKINKPDQRIYHMAAEDMQLAFQDLIFLDDLGTNLKSGGELGMRTIKVEDHRKALTELEQLLNLKLFTRTPTSKL
ncbi:hypothetical protein PROFUN_10777 [Planoprotostelium fungivorum]|uniref:Uncharacterized protein n=1 Tax=Planoprotostelium fungivorum TaxID=1890364 RepID=A0A2P6NCW9_9EUKA|nr:hypothetical protein PROFUN_10777 [Planoprotostelium fungivorum]